MAGMLVSRVMTSPLQPLPLTGQEMGIDVRLKVLLITAEVDSVENPRLSRRAKKHLRKAQQRVSRRKKGSKRRNKARTILAKKHQKVQRQRRNLLHKVALSLVRPTTRSFSKTCGSPTWYETDLSPSPSRMLLGSSSAPSSYVRQHGPASEWWRFPHSTPARSVQAAERACSRVSRCAPMSARLVAWCSTATRTRR